LPLKQSPLRWHLSELQYQNISSHSELSKVGMRGIESPILVETYRGKLTVPASIDAFVNLRTDAKGIHMSRLYHLIQMRMPNEVLTPKLLKDLHRQFLESHKGLSDWAEIGVRFSLPIERSSLKSQLGYWRNYPLILRYKGTQKNPLLQLGLKIKYSSTCPASTALARDLLAEDARQISPENLKPEALAEWIRKDGPFYTPHAQRSIAKLLLCLKLETSRKLLTTSIENLINEIESALGTPVQGAVKRVDEQEFTRMNGQNLMFCEDAARKVGRLLKDHPLVQSYSAEFDHVESLHPHSAVSHIRG
jgi:GTP cyclohydrolase I